MKNAKPYFKVYGKNFESQTRQENIFDLNQIVELQATLEDKSELTLLEQGQFREQDLETDFLTASCSLISCNSKTIQNKKEIAASTDFPERLKDGSTFNLGSI